LQLLPQILIVVNLAVEHDPNGPVFVRKRLVSASQIDDRESAKSKSNLSGHMEALVIGTPMNDRIRHGFHLD
jgi:hypothetical protein